jgi:hypothetical protein
MLYGNFEWHYKTMITNFILFGHESWLQVSSTESERAKLFYGILCVCCVCFTLP